MQSLVFENGLGPAPASFNMAGHVLRYADQTPAKAALEILRPDGVQIWTYGQLAAAVRGTATGLLRLGLKSGDRVILRLGNSAEFPITYLGCIAVGLIPVPLSAQLAPPEVSKISANIRPACTVQSDDIAPATGQTLSADKLAAFHDLPAADFQMGDPDRPAYIIHTSGTSGQARAVVHAHRAVWARQMMWDGWYGLRSDDRLLHAGAFNWTYTLGTGLMDPWAIGATAVIPSEDCDVATLPALLAQSKASIFAAAPGVYRRLLRAEIPAMPHLRHGLSAGEKLPEAVKSAWIKATGTQVHEAFGMSECSTFISGNPLRATPCGASGFAQAGRRVAIVENGQPVARGVVGTIAIDRDDMGLMLAYLDAPHDTRAKFNGDWFLTGDLGVMDGEGAITYAGRADDMMNAGGFRVSPIEVETALTAHSGITEVAAAQVQIKPDVHVIAAFYVSTDVIQDADLSAFCAKNLAGYKCPRLFVRVETLPRGANNKLLRRVLRQDWEAANGQT